MMIKIVTYAEISVWAVLIAKIIVCNVKITWYQIIMIVYVKQVIFINLPLIIVNNVLVLVWIALKIYVYLAKKDIIQIILINANYAI